LGPDEVKVSNPLAPPPPADIANDPCYRLILTPKATHYRVVHRVSNLWQVERNEKFMFLGWTWWSGWFPRVLTFTRKEAETFVENHRYCR
jgi:hypothetical protein